MKSGYQIDTVVKPVHHNSIAPGLVGFLILLPITLVLGIAAYWRGANPGWIALAGAVAILIWISHKWSHDCEKRMIDSALATTPENGLLSDDVFNTSPVWRIDMPVSGRKIYLNSSTRSGLRRDQLEPTHVGWWVGSDKPHGENLAHAHPVRIWTLEDPHLFLIEGDEACFVCKTV